MVFSKTEWVASLNEKLRDLFSGIRTDPIVVQYVLTESNQEPFPYHLSLIDDDASVEEGEADKPDIVFTVSVETAERIQAGSLSTEEAFLRGLLTVDGDIGLLVNVHDQIEKSKT